MDTVGAMKAVVGAVGSNIVSSAKDATKHVVDKFRQKTGIALNTEKSYHKDSNDGIQPFLSEADDLESSKQQYKEENESLYENESKKLEKNEDLIFDFRDRVVSEQEFNKLSRLLSRNITLANRLNTSLEKQIWLTPRRFRTTIRSVQIDNLTENIFENIFLEFQFGGTLTEVRLIDTEKNTEVPRLLGYPPCYQFYTHSVNIKPTRVHNLEIEEDDIIGNNSVDIGVNETFEWRGSYIHLERELFRIIAWKNHSMTVNELLAYHEDTLKNYATGSVSQMLTLSKHSSNGVLSIFRVSLQIVFQEIYDFQINLAQFSLRVLNDEDNEIMNTENGHEICEKHHSVNNLISKYELGKANETESSSENDLVYSNMRECRLNFYLPSYGTDNPFPSKCQSQWSTCGRKNLKILKWENIGMIPFRGTIHELERNQLHFTLQVNPDKSKFITLKSPSSYSGVLNLKNIIHYPYVQAKIDFLDGEVGILEGKIEFGNIPKYQQLGNILEIDDESKLYLIVKILRIDNLMSSLSDSYILQDKEEESIDVYVQVTFDGNKKETPIISGSLHPLFQSELTFVLDVISPTPQLSKMSEDDLIKLLESKGPILLDVWRKTKSVINEHLGWAEINWKDILMKNKTTEYLIESKYQNLSVKEPSEYNMINTSSTFRRLEYRKFYDRTLGKEVVYETRVYQGCSELYNLGTRPAESDFSSYRHLLLTSPAVPKVYVEIWTKPDFSILPCIQISLDGTVSQNLQNRLKQIVELSDIGISLRQQLQIRSNIYYWESLTKRLEAWGRQFSYYGIDSRGVKHLLPSFIQPLKPLPGITNASKVHHFIHAFPFLPSSNNSVWRTPDLFLLSRQGTQFDHALLHVCLLIGLNKVAFLACGTLWNRDKYTWVITMHYEYNETKSNVGSPTGEINENLKNLKKTTNSAKKSPKTSSNSISQRGLKFYALFWDTVKHVVYRLDNIIKDTEANNFLKWLREEEYDLSLLSLSAEEFLLAEKLKNEGNPINYKPNFCLKVTNRLPYRTLDIIFNNKNIFANIQSNGDPNRISYNIADINSWFPFFPKKNLDYKSLINESIPVYSSSNQSTLQLPNTNSLEKKLIKPITQLNSHISPNFTWPEISLGYNHEINLQNIDGEIHAVNDINQDINNGNSNEIDMYCRDIIDEIMKYVQVQRFQKSRTIGTRWKNDSATVGYLKLGLNLLHKWETSDPYTTDYYKNREDFLNWRDSLLSTLPKKCRMKYAILTFPCSIPRWIAQQIWLKCPFLSNETDKRSFFSLAINVISWPNNIKSIHIIILVIHPLKQAQLRKLKLVEDYKIRVINETAVLRNTKLETTSDNKVLLNKSKIIREDQDGGNITDHDILPPFPSSVIIDSKDEEKNVSEVSQTLTLDQDEGLSNSVNKQYNLNNGNIGENKKSNNQSRSSSQLFSEDEPEFKVLKP
ncbi:C2 domain-containing protein [Cryptosporidium muris RN66]|uniref:C2 domain-containing protein n=1 Tax=Cryptosporidium muris (strain RN66) TaxID=441375 RepID=B6ABJ4_CRYMR|nr:C2 domain-containing protein [Cryptosporidium muris RN66]EEA05746.1 C2 domain-containing protein [Cryptosporidium muris RN66]|eukprot:XP_002140095.1 C2 domain-containing protein [Cryptosporidium muris RN66]